MVGSLEVIKAGLLTTVQDRGRRGMAYYAIPSSGALDQEAAVFALKLVDQSSKAPLLECTYLPPTLLFHAPARLALTGADFRWTINGKLIARKKLLKINTGDLLSGDKTQKGFRGYLALDGDFDVPSVYGSQATYTTARIGGLEGRPLQKGDVLKWTETKSILLPDNAEQPSYRRIIPLRRGPEIDNLTTTGQQLLVSQPFRIGKDSNRMGARLEGNSLGRTGRQLTHSVPVLPGFLQLPPNGLPIVLLQDGQVSGGYPRIAYIPERFLGSFNQIPLGGVVRFAWV